MLSDCAENRFTNDRKQTYPINSAHRMYESRNLSVEENEDGDTAEVMDRLDLVNSKTINDILKYGAHQCDSNPIETQSEWSDDGDDDEAKGKFSKKIVYN